ncbi:MAG: type II toxin-antitoxin system RelE/ParE family toxin [Flavobacteriales bacterium]|jgi:plasmid stabilization system protein ParE|nr:type II toxin-antitoxin system RelE/ParE family toxin [Flavobacteriales bacterium]
MKTKPFRIELLEEAELDFDKSYGFYHESSPKIADTFLTEINIGFESIKHNSTAFPIVYKDIRKYVVKKFPFMIYYRIEDVCIQVIAVFHTSRSPEIWNKRI